MARIPDHKAVVDTIVDEELDAQALIAEIAKHGAEVGAKVSAMAKRVLNGASAKKALAQHHPDLAKQLLRQAFNIVFLNAYLSYVRSVQQLVDRNLKLQVAAIKKYGKPITTIDAVRDEDVKARVAEKAGVGGS